MKDTKDIKEQSGNMKVISYEKHREPIKIGCLFYV